MFAKFYDVWTIIFKVIAISEYSISDSNINMP